MIMIIADPGRSTSISEKEKVLQSSLSTHFRSYQSFYGNVPTCSDILQSSFYQSRHILINMYKSTPHLNISLLQGIIPESKRMIVIITDPGRNTSIFKKKKVFQSSLSTHFRSYQSFYSSMITCADIPQSSFYQSRHIDTRSFSQCIVKLIIADRFCDKK